MKSIATLTMLSDVTATGAGESFPINVKDKTFHAFGSTGSGSGAASVKIQVSNDNTNWIDLATISLTLGTSVTSDGFASAAPWKYFRGYVSSISGTSAKISLIAGAEI